MNEMKIKTFDRKYVFLNIGGVVRKTKWSSYGGAWFNDLTVDIGPQPFVCNLPYQIPHDPIYSGCFGHIVNAVSPDGQLTGKVSKFIYKAMEWKINDDQYYFSHVTSYEGYEKAIEREASIQNRAHDVLEKHNDPCISVLTATVVATCSSPLKSVDAITQSHDDTHDDTHECCKVIQMDKINGKLPQLDKLNDVSKISIIRAIETMHANGITHNDLFKVPQTVGAPWALHNLLIKDGHVFLIDFGIAYSVDIEAIKSDKIFNQLKEIEINHMCHALKLSDNTNICDELSFVNNDRKIAPTCSVIGEML